MRRRRDGYETAREVNVKPNIELHIEELVLHGFSPHGRHAIADAVRDQLAARLAERGMNAAGAEDVSIERLDAGTIALPPGPAAAGRALGNAIHSTVGPGDAGSKTRPR